MGRELELLWQRLLSKQATTTPQRPSAYSQKAAASPARSRARVPSFAQQPALSIRYAPLVKSFLPIERANQWADKRRGKRRGGLE